MLPKNSSDKYKQRHTAFSGVFNLKLRPYGKFALVFATFLDEFQLLRAKYAQLDKMEKVLSSILTCVMIRYADKLI